MIRRARTAFLEAFLITAVLTVLGLRVYLAAAHYPQLGGNGLHIAHVLWGGLAMAIAIGMLLTLLTWRALWLAAVVGGAGLGLFIDELGKFLTSDNNYFFKPAPALIYILFVLFFLTAREVRRFAPQTPPENLVNAVELAEALPLGRLTRGTRARALALLSASDPAQPLVPMLRQAFEQAPLREQTSRLDALMLRLRAAYGRLSDHRWFRRLVGFAFVLQVGAMLLAVVYSLRLAAASEGLVVWVILAAAAGAVLLTTFGVVQLWRSRARAYRAFELAVLLDLLLVQPFTLLYSGFAGLTHVLTDLVLLASVWYAGHQERNIQLSG